jgi:hypothetical protein
MIEKKLKEAKGQRQRETRKRPWERDDKKRENSENENK